MAKRFPKLLALCGVLFLSNPAGSAESPPLAGVAYSPSNVQTETQAAFAAAATLNKLRADLAPLKALTPRIRTYSVDNGLDQVVPVAKALGLKVSVGIWLGRDATKNGPEIDRAVATIKANPGTVDRVFVGNETLVRHDLGESALRAYMGRVKSALEGLNIEVGTAEPWNNWIDNPKLAERADFIGAHIFPYWDGVPEAEATAYVTRRYKELQAAFPNKKIVIAETGWPAAGPQYKGAIPSPAAQARYVKEFARVAAAARYDYYICEAYDQPWKAAREGGVIGAAWGIMDANLRAKFPLR